MKKDTYERQKAFAGEKKPSMHRRCLDHDYQERQMYMLTLTTEGRRRLTDADIQARVQEALAQAALGAVHISPAISPGEKAVMRALLNARRPIVFLEENGLTPYTKPGGQLLILSPWQHHNERLTITRNQCLTLNAMAAELCKE